MPRAIVLHAGFHKTGTSTIQQLLRENRRSLKPHLALRLKPQIKPLLHACRGYSTWRDPITLAKATHRFAALLDSLPKLPARTFLISAEELSGHLPGHGEIADYSAAVTLTPRLAGIAMARFPDLPVHLHFSTRAPDTWLRSAWAEHVKSSSLTLDLDEFTARHAPAGRLEDMVARIANAAPCPVSSARLEDNCTAPAAPLLRQCGVPEAVIERLAPIAPINTRLPETVLLELLQANRAYGDRAARKAAKQAILAQAGQ